MKKNKNEFSKGFTLVELLAVLVVLVTILLIALPSITSSVERNKQKMLDKKIDLIEAAAETYVDMYKNKIDYDNFKKNTCGINVSELTKEGLLTTEDLLDADNKEIGGSIWYDKENKKYYHITSGAGDANCVK